jgi:regulator of protease activity HflC (stomatin/prohibitin superfamily)
VHELSDAGWRWCGQQLAAAPSGRGSSLERAHYRVFAVFARYLDAAGLSLADIVRPQAEAQAEAQAAAAEAEAEDLTTCIEAGYRSLAASSGEFVSLRELRLRLPGRPRPDVDGALTALFTAQRINLIPQSNQRALSDADRHAALRIGGEDKHLISIE